MLEVLLNLDVMQYCIQSTVLARTSPKLALLATYEDDKLCILAPTTVNLSRQKVSWLPICAVARLHIGATIDETDPAQLARDWS